MKSGSRRFLLVATGLAVAIPAIAQVQNATSPAAPQAAPAQPQQPQPQQAPAPSEPAQSQPAQQAGDVVEETVEAAAPPPPVEYPRHARRDPFTAGARDPVNSGLGSAPWGQANGQFLSTLMRHMDTPLVSRWGHIGLRNALIASARAPEGVNPVDWAAERSWLLLRMGEADAAQMVVASVDTDRYTPKMVQVAVQSALANSDPLAFCPLTEQMRRVEARILPPVQAICSGLNGEGASAKAQIESIRRRGAMGGIDLALAQKAVGATADTGTAATIEWEPVTGLTAWRYGLATATGMSPPQRLLDTARPQLRAWYASAPMIPLENRLESARIATGLGVFSSQALTDFYSWIFDSTDPNELGGTDSWQLRLAYAARDLDKKLAAMRHLWALGDSRIEKEASRALIGGAAARIRPSAELQADAPEMIASMLSAGMDREAARWAAVVDDMDDEYGDPAWAMLALGAPDGTAIDYSASRINAFIGRDESRGKKRSSLLVAGLAALGRINAEIASRLNSRHRLDIARSSPWTQMIGSAARRKQSGSVLVLAGTGLQAGDFQALPSAHLFHIVMALRNTDQQFLARMIAAEALART